LRHRCFLDGMGRKRLRLSAVRTCRSGPAEGAAGTSTTPATNCALVASPAVVPSATRVPLRRTAAFASIPLAAEERSRRSTPAECEWDPVAARVQGIWNSSDDEGLSEEARRGIVDSWRPATRRSYASKWLQWSDWCNRRSRDPLSPTPVDLTNFLADKSLQGVAPSSLGVYRSAVLSGLHPERSRLINESELPSRYIKGKLNQRPPRGLSAIWNAEDALLKLESWGRTESLTLDQLTRKTVLLLRLATACRTSDLALIDVEHIRWSDETAILFLQGLRKTARPDEENSLQIHAFPESPQRCPLATLREYLRRTVSLRTSTRLFVTWRSPHGPAHRDTLARWTRETLTTLGINEAFSAHSTRSASSSLAYSNGTSLSDILAAASWRSNSTFFRFYRRDIADSSIKFASSVFRGTLN